mmetsp:Transcript_21469/g.63366  ORF Transcript_21469/g.63366 Transcript_21469/m.63366 type:complete len:163 (+) Transcript_21469:447-935(+)
MNTLVVHAGVVPGVPLVRQRPENLLKMRNILRRPGMALAAIERDVDGSSAWASAYDGSMGHIVFGHDAKRGLQREAHATGLDTGCCYGKELSALVLPQREVVSVPARRVYEKPGAAADRRDTGALNSCPAPNRSAEPSPSPPTPSARKSPSAPSLSRCQDRE